MLRRGVGTSHGHREVLQMGTLKTRQRHGNWCENRVKNQAPYLHCAGKHKNKVSA